MKKQDPHIDSRQCRTARAILGWSIDDLANAATLGRATIARFEKGDEVKDVTKSQLRDTFEAHKVRFVTDGSWAGVVSRMTVT